MNIGVVHKLHQHFFTNFWRPLPPHQQPSAIHRHPLPHMSSFNFFTLLPLSCNSFQSKVRGVMRFLLKFHFYLNVKVHNIPFGTPTILTQKISYTRQITQKRNIKWKNFTNFLLTSSIYEHPLPHISNHQHFDTSSPLKSADVNYGRPHTKRILKMIPGLFLARSDYIKFFNLCQFLTQGWCF